MYYVVYDQLNLSLILLSYPRCLQTCSMYVFCGGLGVLGQRPIYMGDAAARHRLRREVRTAVLPFV